MRVKRGVERRSPRRGVDSKSAIGFHPIATSGGGLA